MIDHRAIVLGKVEYGADHCAAAEDSAALNGAALNGAALNGAADNSAPTTRRDGPSVVVYRNSAELRAAADLWDDLWQRSDVAIPTARTLLVAQWIERFAPHADFHAIAVQHDGRLLAALPIYGGKLGRVLSIARLPENVWSWAGDLLLDPLCDIDRVLDLLVDAICRLPWPLVRCDGLPLESARWQQLLTAFARRRCVVVHKECFRVGTVDMMRPWEAYLAARPAKFRSQLRKMTKRAYQLGGIEIQQHHPRSSEALDTLLQAGFEIEDRSWKGDQGSSILKKPDQRDFVWQQAAAMAELGHLELTFLSVGGEKIAFQYGWLCKGVCYSHKVGYDQSFAQLSPGQLLRLKMLERHFADDALQSWDFLGPLTEANERWATGSYSIDRLIVSTRPGASRLALQAFEWCWPTVRRLRNTLRNRRIVISE